MFPRRQQLTHRRVWWTTFGLFTVVGLCWLLTSPPFGAPDEQEHVIRAASASRGQILPAEPTYSALAAAFEVPHAFADSANYCFNYHGDVPASCANSARSSSGNTEAQSRAAFYPPGYYALVGLPSLIFPSELGVYTMRLFNTAVSAALLASAVTALWARRSSALGIVGVALAATPVVFYLLGGVNPSGPEIAAAIYLWVGLSCLISQPSERRRRLLLRIAVAGCVLAVSRPASMLWLVLIPTTIAFWVGWRQAVDVIRDRRSWLVTGVVSAMAVSTAIWVQVYKTLDRLADSGAAIASGGSLDQNLRTAIGNSSRHVMQMIGTFGQYEVQAGYFTTTLWLFGIGSIATVALVTSGARHATVLLSLVAAVVILPIAIGAQDAGTETVWQGRYTLPLAAGIPILAAMRIHESGKLPTEVLRRLAMLLLILFVLGQVCTYYLVARRYAVGANGTLNWLTADGWQTPLPSWLLFVGFVAALTITARWLYNLANNPELTP